MKKLLFILLFIPALSLAQVEDSTAIKLNQIQSGLEYMKMNLQKSQREYNHGIALSLAGAFTMYAATSSNKNAGDISEFTSGSQVAFWAGVGMAAGGIFLILDSHKFIGRAGKWHFSGNSISYDL